MSDILMLFDPISGIEKPYPSHAAQYRQYHGMLAWIHNPWTGTKRSASDITEDPTGYWIMPPVSKFDFIKKS